MANESHRGMEPAQAGLQKIAHSLLRTAPPDEAPMIAWPLACGPQVAEKTSAVRFAAGVLTVQVPDAAWREQLRDMAASYVRALGLLLGGRVQRVEFVVAEAATERR
jgi:hypothetical protein